MEGEWMSRIGRKERRMDGWKDREGRVEEWVEG
jgi:hypothetical protein